MGLKIDLIKAKEEGLTDEERTFLETRDRWHDIAFADDLPDGEAARQEYLASERNQRTAGEGQRVQGVAVYPPIPSETSNTTGNVDAGDEDTPYEDLTVPKLKEELKARHKSAVDAGEVEEVEASTRFSISGSKQELIDRLYEDDRLVAAADSE